MEQEKNLNEEISETVEDVVEEVVDAAEEVVEEITEETAEVVNEIAEERPEVYDDFSEEYEEKAAETLKKEIEWTPKKIIGASALISTVVSLVAVLLVSLCVKYIPVVVTSVQTAGVWEYDMGSSDTQEMKAYIVMKDGIFTVGTSAGGSLFSCNYKVIEGGKIEVESDEANAGIMSNFISSSEVKVRVEDDNIIFTPTIGGIGTWARVDDEEAKNIEAIISTPITIPDATDDEYVDITE